MNKKKYYIIMLLIIQDKKLVHVNVMKQKKLMEVATPTVATNILPKGTTAHEIFKPTIQSDEDSTWNITEGSNIESTIRIAHKITGDEIEV